MEHARTLAELIADTAATNGDKAAVIFQDQPLCYAQLNAQIERAANALAARGIAHGDRVALMLPNIPQFVVAYYAILRLGAVVVPLNVLYKADEVGYMLRRQRGQGHHHLRRLFYPRRGAGIPAAPSVRQKIVVGPGAAPEGTTPWAALVDGAAPQRPAVTVQPGDLAVICYTSGTTGRSEGGDADPPQLHRQLRAVQPPCPATQATADDSTLLVLPLFHIYAMNVGHERDALRVGGTIILIDALRAGAGAGGAPAAIARTLFYGAPPMYVAWVNMPGLEQLRPLQPALQRLRRGGAARRRCSTASSELHRRQHSGGLRPDRDRAGHAQQCRGPRVKPGTIGWPIPGVECPPRGRATTSDVPDGHGRRDHLPRRERHQRLLEPPGGDRRGAARRLVPHRRHRARWTTRATSRSWTARRT